MTDAIQLIVGLANPGREYEHTRHNAGAWYVNALARRQGVSLSEDKKYFGHTASFTFEGERIHLLIPNTFMNLSGKSTAALATFFKIPVQRILIAHDELDLPPGVARLKTGGGHGGHNGLKDVIAKHANQKDFHRLRIGIGHPGDASQVVSHVLSKPSAADLEKIERAIDEAVYYTGDILRGNLNTAMTNLNSFRV